MEIPERIPTAALTSEISLELWENLQSQVPSIVTATLVEKQFWSTTEGPTDRFAGLTMQLARYFGFYPDSETLRAEFKNDFSALNQREQDSLFRLAKSLHLGREFLYFDG